MYEKWTCIKACFSQHKSKMTDTCIYVKGDHHFFVYHSFFILFCIKWLVKSWLKMTSPYIYIFKYIVFFILIHLKGFHRQDISFCFRCLGCTVIAPHCHHKPLCLSRAMVVHTLGGTGEVSFGPFPSFRMRPLPPAGSPSLRCYVESWLTAFPPFMVGVPELFLERCLSSISCSDGSLYIQTVEKMESQGKGWKQEERRGAERRGEWGQ